MRNAWKRIPKDVDPQKQEELKKEPLERGDVPAMLFAAFITIFLPAVLILLLLCGLVYLLFFML
ncbi:MAG: hypothetical protein K2H45_10950 [Acetatifactor sp.]|nr:hypothetical protein [Acetatifactor sp.]